MDPKIDPKWWKKNKPLLMKSTGFGDALAHYLEDLAAYEKAVDFAAVDKAFAAVKKQLDDTLPKAAGEAQKLCKSDSTVSGYLDTYKSTTFPNELKRVQTIQDGRLKDFEKEAEKVKDEAMKANIAIEKLLSDQKTDQGKLLQALGGVDKARQVALRGRNALDKNAGEAAGRIATEAMELAQKLFGGMGRRHKEAESIYVPLSSMAKQHGGKIEGIRKDSDLLVSKIRSMVDEMGYEMQDALKAENELRNIITGTASDEDALKSTVGHICSRFSMQHRELQGTVNQAGGAIEQVEFDLMNALEKGGAEAERALVPAKLKIVTGMIPKMQSIVKQVQEARSGLVDDLKSLPREVLRTAPFKDTMQLIAKTTDKEQSLTNATQALGTKFKKLLEKLQASARG